MEGKSPNKHNKLFFIVEPLEEDVAKAIKEGKLPERRYKKKEDEVTSVLRDLGWDAKVASKVKAVIDGNMFLDQTRGIVHIGEVMEMTMECNELGKKIRKAVKAGTVTDIVGAEQINQAEKEGVLTKEEATKVRDLDAARMEYIHVDDFAYNEIGRKPLRKKPWPDNK